MKQPFSLLAAALTVTLGLAGCHTSNDTAATSPATPAPAAAPVPETTAAPAVPAQAATAALKASVAIQVGGEPELDPCMSARIKADGDHRVLAGPGEEHPVLASLAAGQIVHICDPGGEHWYAGIIWHEDDSVDCGISSPVAERADYAGSCHSGWISIAALEELAG